MTHTIKFGIVPLLLKRTALIFSASGKEKSSRGISFTYFMYGNRFWRYNEIAILVVLTIRANNHKDNLVIYYDSIRKKMDYENQR